MKVIYDISGTKKYKNAVLGLGVFDGVHLAHRYILKEVVKKARDIKGVSVAVTFWPHPQKEESLYSLEHRLRLIGELGIDVTVVINFNKKFSQLEAEDFIRDILVAKLGARYVYVGKNFRFGRYAKGDCRLLEKLSKVCRFKVKVFDVIKINNRTVSSTYIRRLITKGKLDLASRLLARPVSIFGTVIKGTALGRMLGFPTANINPHHEIVPPSGIYAVRVMRGKKKLFGACYIGTKPTIKKSGKKNIEVYLFNFNENIYGEDLDVQFIKKIREDRKFATKDALVDQIKKDVIRIKKIFSSR